MGHPPQPPYRGYPPPHDYPYTQAPPMTYYPNDYVYNGGDSSLSCCYCIFLFSLMFLLIGCSTLWFFIGPLNPTFRVKTLTISNLKIINPDLSANWEANLEVRNPSNFLKVDFERIFTSIAYKNDIVSSLMVEPMDVDTEEDSKMILKSSSMHIRDTKVVDDMSKERNDGVLTFNLKLIIDTIFKRAFWSRRQVILKVSCNDLKVGFVGTTDNGVANGNGKECKVEYDYDNYYQ